jgi:predicted dehydrogenase
MVVTGLGFAGVGWLGESLIKDLPGVPGLELAAVQDTRLDLAREIGARYASPWVGDRFEALLEAPGVDAVVVCTPNALHVPQAQRAMQAGKHVLVQKPLALTFAEAQATVDVAHASQRLLFVDYTYRFLETTQPLRTRAEDIVAVRAAFHNIYGPGAEKTWFFDPALSGGGALTDLGVHLLDLALWLLQPRHVTLEYSDLDAQPIERRASLRARLDDVPFALEVSWNAPVPDTQIFFELQTGGGRMRWENVDGSFFRFRTWRDESLVLDRQTSLRIDTLQAFASALQTGQAPPIDARVYAVLDQAYGRAARLT